MLRANAPATLFLQQDPSERAVLQDLFHLSDVEVALFDHVRKHAGWSSAYLRLPGHTGGLIRLVPDAFTRWLVSQEDRERALREQTCQGDRRRSPPGGADAGHALSPRAPGRDVCVIRVPSAGCSSCKPSPCWRSSAGGAASPLQARLGRLGAVMVAEHVPTVPPEGLVAQVAWLYAHRLRRLTGVVGVGVVAGILGIGEGLARRRTDVLGGFLLRWWTAGVVGLALMPGMLGGALLVPWPLPGWAVASGLALLVALVMYGLTAGRPYVP